MGHLGGREVTEYISDAAGQGTRYLSVRYRVGPICDYLDARYDISDGIRPLRIMRRIARVPNVQPRGSAEMT